MVLRTCLHMDLKVVQGIALGLLCRNILLKSVVCVTIVSVLEGTMGTG